MASKKKPTPEQPVLIARAALTKPIEKCDVVEIWDAGDYCFGLTSLDRASAVELFKRRKFAPGAESSFIKFPDIAHAWDWFIPNLRVRNDHWLEIDLGDGLQLFQKAIEALTFQDQQSVEIAEFAEDLGVNVDERMFDSLAQAASEGEIIYKPVRVDNAMIVGFKRRDGDISWIGFIDDWDSFRFVKTYASFSWFMDNTGAPISWSGGLQIGSLTADESIVGIDVSDDDDEGRQIWERPKGRTIAESISYMFVSSDPPSDHFAFLEMGLVRTAGVFTDREWTAITEAANAATSIDDGYFRCNIEPPYRQEVHNELVGGPCVYASLVEFVTNPEFPNRELVLKSWPLLVQEWNGYVWDEVVIRGWDHFGVLNVADY